ncbi:MAG: FtsW/RodA/SpoVE family cell cycle protein [Ardenticatenaceae bacterium]|nr:FtsW/RodA/SpoVE family cell cycle protein [Ardenticatenaceae bacterium]
MNWIRQHYFDRLQLLLLGLAIAFVLNTGITWSLVSTGEISWQVIGIFTLWLGGILGAFFYLRWTRPYQDPLLFPLAALLMGWGMWLVARLAPNFMWRQVIWVILALAVLVVAAVVPARFRPLRKYPYTWMFGGLLLLAATLVFGVNPSGGGARLWLKIPFLPVFFQPSELLKILFIIFLASYFSQQESLKRLQRPGRRFGRLPYLAPLFLVWGFCVTILVWQRDLGAATIFFLVFLTLVYLATGDLQYVGGGILLLLAAGILAYFLFDLVALRIDTWINPWPEADNRAFQIVQSLYALGAGGVFGKGIGLGFPQYIPVVHSDFAFAAIGEEWGLIGTIFVISCFMVLILRGFRIAFQTKWPFDFYLAAGISVMFFAQTLLIMGGVSRLLPLTGVTLPFVSYGGSSLLISSLMLGLLIYLSDRSRREDQFDLHD